MTKVQKIIIVGFIILSGLFLLFFKKSKISYQILTTPVSPLYYVKISREYMQSLFIFGDEDLAYWYFTLANKRINEAEILQKEGFENLTIKQLNIAAKHLAIGNNYLSNSIDKIDVNYLIQMSNEIKNNIDSFKQNY